MSAASQASSDSLYDEALDERRSTSPPSDDEHLDAGFEVLGKGACAGRACAPARYAFAQAFGERAANPYNSFDVQDADMISAVRFNHDASMVATGDRGGRVVLLRRSGAPPRRPRVSNVGEGEADGEDDVTSPGEPPEYGFWTQFQSHEQEFDYLRSTEIEERINAIRWCRAAGDAQRLLITNDKTVKLWRVGEREVRQVVSFLGPTAAAQGDSPTAPRDAAASFLCPEEYARKDTSSLVLPKITRLGHVVSATPRRIYANCHAYHINSIALSSDEETFLSADDLRINVWSLARGNSNASGFNVVDIKPDNMEDLTEVITCAEFHPTHCHIFCHSSSRGAIKLCDLRQAALCDNSAMVFEEPIDPSARSTFFSEIIASIADVKFSPCGRRLLTRDYMNLRLWDMRMERAPVLTVPVQEALRPHLADLYENDAIFDKFRCAFSHDGHSILTGGYNSQLQSYSAYNGVGAAVEATVDFVAGLSSTSSMLPGSPSHNHLPSMLHDLSDQSRKICHFDAAQQDAVAAVAAGPALYMYYVPNV